MADRDFCAKDGKWIMVMHEFICAIAKQNLSGAERRVLDCVMLEAWGKNHEAWAIIRWKDIIEFTGLSSGTASKAKIKLEQRNIIKCFQEEAHQGVKYRINSKVGTWEKCFLQEALPKGSETASKRKQHPIKNNKKGVRGEHDEKEPAEPKWTIPDGAKLKIENPWINETAWDEFVVHRADIGHKLTELAVTKSVNLLEKHRDCQQEIIDKTIRNNWRGLFEPKPKRSKSQLKGAAATVARMARRYPDESGSK